MKFFLLSLSILILTSTALGQETLTGSAPKGDDSISSSGIRVSLMSPFLRAKFKASFYGQDFSADEGLATSYGFSVGYAYLPIYRLGWTADFAYLNIENDGVTTGAMRIDANLGTSFNKMVNIKGGINLSKLVFASGVGDYNPGLGAQASVGLQLNKNFGVDLGYLYMTQSANLNGSRFDLAEYGPEVDLTGTF